MKVLTAAAMRTVDRRAIEEVGIPSLVLMENAAAAAADAVGELFPEAGEVAIVCGPGNNGGDGLALARRLTIRGYGVTVLLWAGSSGLRGDAAVQNDICAWMGVETEHLEPTTDLKLAVSRLSAFDLLVDALFGTGLGRPLEGPLAELVERLDALPIPKLALDMPSGLDGSRAAVIGPHLSVDATVAFGAPKVAHVFLPTAESVGELVVADLGIPAVLYEEAEGDLHLLERSELAESVLARDPESHKGDHGHVLIVAGSPGKTGAAVLAARGALRSGAGLVTVATPEVVAPTVDAGSLESMTIGVSCDQDGVLAAAALDELLAAASGKRVVALGPGLGRSAETSAVIRQAVLSLDTPVVLDADAIQAFAGQGEELAKRSAPTVLTPHVGELGALVGVRHEEIGRDRLTWARSAARDTGALVVLKGHPTLVARSDGTVWANSTGNSGMATGGTGDVLLGLVAGLVAQGYPPEQAACLGVYLHGLSGDLALARTGEHSLLAGDLLEFLPEAFASLE